MSLMTDPLRRLANARPGMELVAHHEVAVPLYTLTLDVIVEEQKQVPPIEEYVLRSMDAGMDSIDRVCQFLGLERRLVEVAVHDLWQRDNVDVVGGKLVLAPSGKQVLSELVARAPVRREVYVEFDRMLYEVTGPAVAGRMKPINVRDAGISELPLPHRHARKPRVEELDVESVSPAVKRALKGRGMAPELLAIRGVVRADRVFEEGLVLIYQTHDGTDYTLAVAVDGRLSTAHENALGEAGGAERLGIDFETFRRNRVDLADLVDPALVAMAADEDEIRAVERELDVLELEQQGTADEDVVEEATVPDPSMVEEALSQVRGRLEEFPVRRLRVYEHAPILRRALEEAQERLLIISPWISRAVVDDEFVGLLHLACKRRVDIHIGFGIGGDGPQQRGRDRTPERRLDGLARSFPTFHFAELGNTHAKILIFDGVWITTSFNWLSFKGDPDRTYRQEEGLLVRIPEQVTNAYADFRQQIEAAAS